MPQMKIRIGKFKIMKKSFKFKKENYIILQEIIRLWLRMYRIYDEFQKVIKKEIALNKDSKE